VPKVKEDKVLKEFRVGAQGQEGNFGGKTFEKLLITLLILQQLIVTQEQVN
jgi:hypothetical protein